jgi:acyl dehydratase
MAAIEEDLDYIYERDLRVLPTMAVVLAQQDFWAADPRTGIDWQQMLHGEQFLTIHRPLPASGTVVGKAQVVDIYDKGAAKGAVLVVCNELADGATGEPLASVGYSVVLRNNGGFGGSAEGAPIPHPTPAGEPDAALALATRPEQAFLYRLSGDYNPLHVDSAVARTAGFERPILHGLCTYGVVCRAALKLLCGNDPARLRVFNARFASPVYPGETIRTEIWRQGSGRAALQARVVERDTVVMRNGYLEYA